MKTGVLKFIDICVVRSWWMHLCIIASLFLYFQGMKKKSIVRADLEEQLAQLVSEKKVCTEERDDLLLQVKSQNDPAWVELTLMKELGLVPEGQTKVFFKKE